MSKLRSRRAAALAAGIVLLGGALAAGVALAADGDSAPAAGAVVRFDTLSAYVIPHHGYDALVPAQDFAPAISREAAIKTVEDMGLKVFEARLAVLRSRFSQEEGSVYVAEEGVPRNPVWIVVIDVEGQFGSGGPGWPTPDATLRTGGFVAVDAVTGQALFGAGSQIPRGEQ